MDEAIDDTLRFTEHITALVQKSAAQAQESPDRFTKKGQRQARNAQEKSMSAGQRADDLAAKLHDGHCALIVELKEEKRELKLELQARIDDAHADNCLLTRNLHSTQIKVAILEHSSRASGFASWASTALLAAAGLCGTLPSFIDDMTHGYKLTCGVSGITLTVCGLFLAFFGWWIWPAKTNESAPVTTQAQPIPVAVD